MSIKGRTITGYTYKPDEDYGFDGNRNIVVIELDDGTEIFAMQDDEGNGPGVLMHRTPLGDEYVE